MELTRIEQQWPCPLVEGIDPADYDIQRRYAYTTEPPTIGDATERYVEQALGEELKQAAQSVRAGYIVWTHPPQWAVRRDEAADVWVRTLRGRGALIRIVTDA